MSIRAFCSRRDVTGRPVASMRRWAMVAASGALVTAVSPFTARAQTTAGAAPLTRAAVVVSPAWQSWSFGKEIPLDSIRVSGVSQISAPFAIQIPLGSRWTGSVNGAMVSTSLTAKNDAGAVTRSFAGPTDLRVRVGGPLIGNSLGLTIGVNVPTGTVNLSPAQNDVIRVSAAPALDAQVPLAGLGFGATAGLVYAKNIGPWAWALGASVEKRGKYSPLDAQIAGVDSRTELEPGSAAHVSIGGDGMVGENRLLVGIVTDVYGKDLLHQSIAGGAALTQQYQLGPAIAIGAALEIKSTMLRDLTLRVNERHRSSFRDGNNNTVAGSSGNYIDVGLSGLRGQPGKLSLLLGINAAQHTGLPVDKGFIGAALTAVGGTLGVVIPTTSLEYTARASASVGSLKTSLVTSGITSLTIGLTVRRQ